MRYRRSCRPYRMPGQPRPPPPDAAVAATSLSSRDGDVCGRVRRRTRGGGGERGRRLGRGGLPIGPRLGCAVDVDGDELELRRREHREMRSELLAEHHVHVDEAEDHSLAHVGVRILEGLEERREDLRQDGEELELREARHKLRLQPHRQLQRGRRLLHHYRHEHRHAAVGIRERQQQLERLLGALRHLARWVAACGEQPQQHVLGESLEALGL
mmetsp:Transcript_6944/g.18007  ORF Transcript_6944/g.18007 Transcript_6944/m.18007 type:complete len:214 (-) Transcript_6944:42-683(-)